MNNLRSITTTAAIAAATAMLVTALAFGQTTPPVEPTPAPTATTTEAPVTPVEAAVTETQPAPAPEPAPTVEPSTEPTIEEVGGSIRWASKTKWGFIDDATHQPYGVSRVEVRKDRVRIHFDFKATQVRDFDISVDESFASVNVRAGSSVGLSYADVFFYMGSKSKPVNPALLSKAGANVWFSGSFLVPAS